MSAVSPIIIDYLYFILRQRETVVIRTLLIDTSPIINHSLIVLYSALWLVKQNMDVSSSDQLVFWLGSRIRLNLKLLIKGSIEGFSGGVLSGCSVISLAALEGLVKLVP